MFVIVTLVLQEHRWIEWKLQKGDLWMFDHNSFNNVWKFEVKQISDEIISLI